MTKKNIYTPLFIQLNMSYLLAYGIFQNYIHSLLHMENEKTEKKNNIGKRSDNGLRKLRE